METTSRFGPRLTKMTSPRARHNELINHLANSFTSAQFENVKQLSRNEYFQPKELEYFNTRDFLNALEDKCFMGLEDHDYLKDLLKKSGAARLVQDVEEAEADIKEMKRTVFYDDPSHVKALREHCEKIYSALQEGPTLADVTKTLKRQIILDDQHKMGGSGPEAAWELLHTVTNKRNKGLRATRVLALALWDADHKELAHNILTTWGRRSGRYFRIPSSTREILSSYLDITEKLPEPGLHRVLDHLVSKGKVSEDERATILQQPSRVEKVQEMLDTLLSGDREGAVGALANALIHAGQVDLAYRMSFQDLLWSNLEMTLCEEYSSSIYASSSIFLSGYTGLGGKRGQQLPRVSPYERVTSWKASDSEHGELMKTTICGQWAFSSDEPGQREWRGHKAVIDVETVEEVLEDHARNRKQTVLETLSSIPDVPENSLFILNTMKRPELKTKWEPLLSGRCFPGAKVLLIDGKAEPQYAVKRNVQQAYYLAIWQWPLLEKILSECYRDKLRNLSISDRLADLLSRNRSQTITLPHMTLDKRVVPWPAIDSEHGELVKIVICWQWANSGNEPGQRNWGGHKAVIDLEILDDISGESKETVLKVLDVIPDETLFILNTMKRPDLKTNWSPLLSGKILPEAKVLLIEESDGKGMSHGGMKRKWDSTETSGESTEDCSAKKQRNTTLGTQTEATGVDPSKGKQCTIS